jgi:Domain of unknown function (DUF4338)
MNALLPPLTGPVRFCGRLFTPEEIDSIRRLITDHPQANRVQLSRWVCQALGWLNPLGRPKEMSCRVAMLRMQADGLILLPAPRRAYTPRSRIPRFTHASDPQWPVGVRAHELGELLWRPVDSAKDSSLWNELIQRYHYLGYKTLPGAQIRYLVYGSAGQLLAALGFGAAAWKVAPRDHFIDWTPEQRLRHLHRIVNNARFLIVPWVTSKNLASRILAQAAKRLPHDWLSRYGYSPVLLETFVDKSRFRGTCYKAANWIHVGQTQGRGKLDRSHQNAIPIKEIFLYPLQKSFRKDLRA